MKALKIDVVNQTISKIEITNYKEIYSAIGNGCNLFCCPIEFENGDVLYSDDEALLHGEVEGCFSMVDWNYPLVGNAIILGSDEEGGMADSKTKANEILEKISRKSSDDTLITKVAYAKNIKYLKVIPMKVKG